jgi:GntR family transcriptional repressor for pyruvate dehydrogenase complex
MEESTSREQQVRLDIDFHSTLATASGNVVYRYLLDSLASLLRESRLKTIGLGGIGPAVTGHRSILAAIQARDPESARWAMREHLEASVQDLKKAGKPKGGKR